MAVIQRMNGMWRATRALKLFFLAHLRGPALRRIRRGKGGRAAKVIRHQYKGDVFPAQQPHIFKTVHLQGVIRRRRLYPRYVADYTSILLA